MFLVNILTASVCISFTRANYTTNQNTSGHSVCDSFCTIEELPAVTQLFEEQTTVEKARVVYLTADIRHNNESTFCQDKSHEKSSNSSLLVWVVDEMEPSLHLPANFLRFSYILSPHLKHYLKINLSCNLKTRNTSQYQLGTSLYDAFLRTIVEDLVGTNTGSVCSLREQQGGGIEFNCCELLASETKCHVVQSTKFVGLLKMLYILWFVIAFVILPLYPPGIICFFPSPKVSEEGISCLELGDPSPAGFRSLVAKAFIPRTNNSLMDKTRIFLLRVIFIPCLAVPPLVLGYATQIDFFLTTSPVRVIICFGAYILESLLAAFFPTRPKPCKCCKILSSEPVVHSTIADKVKAHLSLQLYFSVTRCQLFSRFSFSLLKTHFPLRFEPPIGTALLFLKALLFILAFFPALLFLMVGNAYIFFISFWESCPINNLNHRRPKSLIRFILRYRSRSIFRCSGFSAMMKDAEWSVQWLSKLTVVLLVFGSAWTTGITLLYTIMTIIYDVDVLFPYVVLSVLILYYLHSCFRSFSEKYQLLKIKLYQSCKKYQESRKSEEGCTSQVKLILYTKSQGIAIPEELYKSACQELRMPMMRNLWVAVLKAVGFLIFVLSVYCSIVLVAARSGMAPLIQTVAMFFAGFSPKLLQLFSFGMAKQKLEELEMEEQLEDVIIMYVQRQSMAEREEGTTYVEMDSTEATAMDLEVFADNNSDTTIERMDTAAVQE